MAARQKCSGHSVTLCFHVPPELFGRRRTTLWPKRHSHVELVPQLLPSRRTVIVTCLGVSIAARCLPFRRECTPVFEKDQTLEIPRRVLVAASVVAVHGLLIAFLAHQHRVSTSPPTPLLLATFLTESPAALPAMSNVSVPPFEPVPVLMALPDSDLPNDSDDIVLPIAQYAAPQWEMRAADDMPLLTRAAGLAEGTQATVVLRVEVLANGTAGNIVIDRGSGDVQIDAVAIDYAKRQRWRPGMVRGMATPMNVRWAVHVTA